MQKFIKLLIVFAVVESCLEYQMLPCVTVRREDIPPQGMLVNACYAIKPSSKEVSEFTTKVEAEKFSHMYHSPNPSCTPVVVENKTKKTTK